MKHTRRIATAAEILPRVSRISDKRRANVRFGLRLGLVFAVVLLSQALVSQEFRGSMIGQVTDPTGAVVANATITAVGPQQTYRTRTNAGGDFAIPYVQPGTYEVAAEAKGFKRELKQGVRIDVSQKVNLNFSLQIGAATETVTVTAEAVAVNTADASGGTVMDPEKVQNLPLNGRQVYMLLALTPGTRFTTSTFGPTGNSGTRGWDQTNAYEINGVQNNLNQFTLNGANISQQTSTARGAWFVAPNVDAVEEFKVQTNNYDATYGRAGGGTINVVTKSGTNAFHGTAFDYWRNAVFDANFYQSNQRNIARGGHNQHQFGGTFGGPIKKGKTYFFASFEGWREVLPIPVQSTVPAGIVVNADGSIDMRANLAGRNIGGIFNPFVCATTNADGSCKTRQRLSWNGVNDVIPPNLVSPIALKILSLYPQPNAPGFTNNFVGNTRGLYNYSQPMVRIDHDFSDKTRLYGMFTWWSGTEFRNSSGFLDPRIQTGNINNYRSFQNEIVDLTHTFSPTLLADLRFSFSRSKDRSPNGGVAAGLGKLTPQDLGLTSYPVPPTTNASMAPQINVGGLTSIIGNSVFSDTGHPPLNEVFELAGSVTKLHGNHNFKMGGAFWQVYAIPCCGAGNTGNGPGGVFGFDSGFTQQNPLVANNTGTGIASLLLGLPGNGNIPFNDPIYEGYPYFGFYFQDDWKIKKNLTLNLGLRWDAELSPDERYNNLNGGFCATCVSPLTNMITFPALPGGLTMANPVVGGFTFIGNGRAPYDTQWNHWAPKFGVSWGLTPKTVIRGGYGVSWAFGFELGGNTTFTQNTNFQATVNGNGITPTSLFNSGNPYPTGLLVPQGPVAGLLSSAGDGQSFDQRNRRIGRVQQYSLGFQRELPGGIVLDAAYVGSYSSNLRVGTNLEDLPAAFNAACQANPTVCSQTVTNPFFGILPASSTLGSAKTIRAYLLAEPFPQFNGTVFSNTEPVGYSDYNSLQVKFNKRMTGEGVLIRGLSFLTSFTWSKTMVATSYLNNLQGNCPTCLDTHPQYVLGGNDRTLDLSFAGVWGLPIGKGGLVARNASGFLGTLINNWSTEWILTADSGTPISLANIQGTTFNCPQNNNNILPAHQTFNEWLYNETPGCFTPIPTRSWQPRTILQRAGAIRSPYAPQLAMGLGKQFAVREGLNVQFKAEAFNLTNTPIFGGPDTNNPQNPIAPVAGIAPGQPGAFTGYGTIGSIQQNFPRQLQLSLKVLF
jgi:Carboxypeptidase regulatory-like domain/TonB dependent receptor/TonB-dependent Receptor Plug Domain